LGERRRKPSRRDLQGFLAPDSTQVLFASSLILPIEPCATNTISFYLVSFSIIGGAASFFMFGEVAGVTQVGHKNKNKVLFVRNTRN
jgi:hypothetical protein